MVSYAQQDPRAKSSWRSCTIEERQRWADKLFLAYPVVAAVLEHFDSKLSECERKGTATGMFIVGGSGAGKTTLMEILKSIGEHRYARQAEDRKICPVLCIEVPDPCTPIEFSFAILEALGDADPRGRRDKSATHKAAESFLKQCDVRLVLIDNVQDIPARRAKRGVELVSTRIRQLIDKSYATWVFLGTEEARQVINSDPQIVKRVGYRAQLEYFSLKSKESIRVFSRLLEKIDAHLPLAEPSCLLERRCRARIFLATDGIFDRLIKLVDRGWYEATIAEREKMEIEDLALAFEYVHGPTEARLNPFSEAFVFRQLHLAEEPFEVLKGRPIADTSTT